MCRAWIVRPGRRHLATPSRPVVAASLESQSAAGGGPRRTTPRLPHFGGKYEDDPLSGVVTGTRALRPCGCAGEDRPSRDVEVRVPDWRAEADVHTDDQDGRGQARRDDELDADLTISAERVLGDNKFNVEYKFTITGDKHKEKGAVETGGDKREL